MRSLLICFSILAILFLCGCSQGRFSLAHRVEVQQGNVVDQHMVNQLTPGMTKRQVQLVMGTPMIVDVFRDDRWDYPYRLTPSSGPEEKRLVSLYFENDRLTRITGDMAPSEEDDSSGQERVSVSVPYQERERRGILTRLWRFLTFRNREPPQ